MTSGKRPISLIPTLAKVANSTVLRWCHSIKKDKKQVNRFNELAADLNFQINPEKKTKIILFTNNIKTLTVNLRNGNKSGSYLGVTFDRYLSFGIHIKTTQSKMNDKLNMLKVIGGVKYGSHPQTMINIYQALIRGSTAYGCTVIYNSQCLRRTTGSTRSTLLNALMAIAGQDSLEFRSEYVAAKTIARCFQRIKILYQINWKM